MQDTKGAVTEWLHKRSTILDMGITFFVIPISSIYKRKCCFATAPFVRLYLKINSQILPETCSIDTFSANVLSRLMISQQSSLLLRGLTIMR